MAVYKPTYCYPYLEPVDLTIPDEAKYFTCQVDTSNINVTGYKIELYDENNKKVFPNETYKNKISQISELGVEEYIGLNGSELKIPFIQRWNDKVTNSYNAIYFKAKESVDYYQAEDFATDNITLVGAQLYRINGQTGVAIEPVKVDRSYLFVGDRFVAGSKLYEVTYNQNESSSTSGQYFNTTDLVSGDIIYIKGGDENAGKCYQWSTADGQLQANEIDDVWCDIGGNSVALSNKGKTYKWTITLYSGERGALFNADTVGGQKVLVVSYDNMVDNEFNTVLTSGTILGSTEDRIQGPISDKIYAKQWLQLGFFNTETQEFEQVGTRTYIESYSQSLGHIYPISGDTRGFSNDNLYPIDGKNAATHFAVYKYSNDPEQITSQNSVDYAIDFNLTKSGTSASNYSYTISGKDDIDKFNDACDKSGNPKLCEYTNQGTEAEPQWQATYAGKSVLVFNRKDVQDNTLTGYFTITFAMKDNVPTFTFDMPYSYRKVSSYIGKVFFVIDGGFVNQNIVSKAEATGVNDVASLGTPITFVEEEPLEIYPNESKKKDKYYGKIFKNEVSDTTGTVYVSAFTGLQAGARFYLTNGSVIKAEDVDTTNWKVTYKASQGSDPYFSTDALKYELRTNFKSSDETPFYAYDSPRLVPWSTQGLTVKDALGETFLLEYQGQVLSVLTAVLTNISGRFVEVYGQYLQAQNVSWTSYRWLLVDQYGQTIQDTGKKYDGVMKTTFYGLDGPTQKEVDDGKALPNQYYIVLLVEDELGNSLALGMEIKVVVNPVALPVQFTGEFDCKIQAVRLKIQDYGYPTLSKDEGNTAVALQASDGVNYTFATEKTAGSVSITGENNSLMAADQVAIPIEGAQLKHFFAKGTKKIADLSAAPKKLATNDEGNIEFHTKFSIDANYCGEFFKYGVDIFDNFGNSKKLYFSLGLPNNFNLTSGNPDKCWSTLNNNRKSVTCTVNCGNISDSLIGYVLLDDYTKGKEAYYLQPKEWRNDETGDLTTEGKASLEYLDFVYPFEEQTAGTYKENESHTNINEPINTKALRDIGECCLETTSATHYNIWTDLKRVQVNTPAGYRVVQTSEPAIWDESQTKYWVEGWDDGVDTTMVQVKRHPSIKGATFVVDCYMKGVDEFYNVEKFNMSYKDTTVDNKTGGKWAIRSGLTDGKAQIIICLTKEA